MSEKGVIEQRLEELREYAIEPPADLLIRCQETVPIVSPSARRHRWGLRLAMTAATIAVAGFWMFGPRGGSKSSPDPEAAYAATLNAMTDTPYWRLDFTPLTTQAPPAKTGPTTIWFDRDRGKAMRMGDKTTIDLTSGDEWQIWKSGDDARAEVYHYLPAEWTRQKRTLSEIVFDPYASVGEKPGDTAVRMAVQQSADGSRRTLTLEGPRNGGETTWRCVLTVDPANGLIQSRSDFRILANGRAVPLDEARFDYSQRPPDSVFDPLPFLRQGYRKIECWPDEKRRVLLDRDGKVIGRMF